MNECCVLLSNVSVAAAQLYQNYKAWCEANGETAITQNKLGRVLTEKGFDQTLIRNTRTWIGIGLRTEESE
jgi:phage/plasmid-associated DNA primase